MLRKLANSYGVLTRYLDVHGKLTHSSPESVVAVLRALGAPIARAEDASDALRQRRESSCQRVLSPVVALWDDVVAGIRVSLPATLASRHLRARLHLEDGSVRDWSPNARTVIKTREVEGIRYLTSRLPLPTLPYGYHRLALDVDGIEHDSLLVRAPTLSFRDPASARRWGVFAPLYALHSRASRGVASFADLKRLMELTQRRGGDFVSTLPFLASYPGEPSPYSPISRLFWNELYVDTGKGSGRAPAAVIDFDTVAASKRLELETMPRDPSALARFVEQFPLALDYGRFRAFAAAHGADWTRWPEPAASGVVGEADVAADDVRYHLYNQLHAHTQLDALRATGVGLYLDLPLGVHGRGYDTWREQTLFTREVDVGAPPDAAFPGGQNWSTPPILPHKSREQGHRYLRLALRHAMRHASILRIDHIMGLHRQFWIPSGAAVADGVYVRYPAEELYAILNLESMRARCELIGENLGIVPDVVNLAMRRHRLRGLYVTQLTPEADIPEDTVASLNTHDTATFAAYAAARGEDPEQALGPALERLLQSPADIVNIALEDLWLETEPHNVPGTSSSARPNWRRTMRYGLEEMESAIGSTLDAFER